MTTSTSGAVTNGFNRVRFPMLFTRNLANEVHVKDD